MNDTFVDLLPFVRLLQNGKSLQSDKLRTGKNRSFKKLASLKAV
jgi:hypothetical protein